MQNIIGVCLLSAMVCSSFSYPVFADPAKNKLTQSQKQMTKVNLNTTSLEQLVSLPGVGKKKAEAIIEYRTKNGKYQSVDDLMKVKGVGKKMLSKLKSQISI
ncbi:ComEA family DNA-binding protein [Paraglaciecola aquimarina]|uniref:ComEA family DNA-binding protein n=1 Tax=Paraglaciecola algarum TaxID=3050085 RepID=A0ABS9D7S7_9ALTE|nr:ComEA family DNA-binding protein [Paraglaciecola sp. G1-23]MCF2948420.1 ComEA family DNA-binding protein [Paraglaciecola sp. G1-23]